MFDRGIRKDEIHGNRIGGDDIDGFQETVNRAGPLAIGTERGQAKIFSF
jgi:hypothetical protein